MQEYLKITRNGLLNNNQALVVLLGLGLIVALKNLIDSRQIAPQIAANSKATLEPQTN